MSPHSRLFAMLLCTAGLLLLVAGGATLPFVYESQTMFYKFGVDKSLLRAGKCAGIVTVILLSVQLLAAGRFIILDRIFGLNRLLKYHRINGMVILGVSAVHLLLILVPEGIDNLPIGKKFIPEMIGMAVFCLVMPLALVALKRTRFRLSYHIWLPLHRWTGFAVVPLVFLHVRLVSEPFASGIPLAALAGITLPLLLLACRRVAKVLFPSWDWRINKVITHSATLHTLQLVSVGSKPLPFVPGQFVFLRLDSPTLSKEEHPFSISSAPADRDTISLTIRSCGDWTDRVADISAGTRASLSIPFGQFSYLLQKHSPGLLLIAGGIGITPMISMLRHIADTGDTRPVHLLWSFREPSDCIFQEPLLAMSQKLPHLQLTFNCTDPEQGGHRLTEDELKAVVRTLPQGSAAYLCGPGAMVGNLRSTLLQLGLTRRNIHYEYFAF